MRLDVHPDARPLLANPYAALLVTEGTKKADALWSAFDRPTIALAGVFGWRGRDPEVGGVLALADWEEVALRGADGVSREVFLIFDSDFRRNRQVLDALRRLGAFLDSRGAFPRFVLLEDGPKGQKVGADDFIATGADWHAFEALATVDLPAPHAEPEEVEDYSDVPDESGAGLLDAVAAFLAHYVVFRSVEQCWAVATWIVHTWAFESFSTTGRLAILSPEPRCGKTRLLEIVESLGARPELLADVTSAYLFRVIEEFGPTLLIDETDALFAPRANGDPKAEDVRAIINAGYRRGATVGRCVPPDNHPARFRVFAPVALAGIGKLPATVLDRSIIVRLRRRGAGESVDPFEVTDPPAEVESLRRRMGAWSQRNAETLVSRPALPDDVTDRLAEVWRPSFAIAQAAGGHWPERVEHACAVLRGAAAKIDRESEAVALLGDIRTVHNAMPSPGLGVHTVELLRLLLTPDDSRWRAVNRGLPLDAIGLARRLADFDVTPRDIKLGGVTRKGYRWADFADAWSRYLDPEEAKDDLAGEKVADTPDLGATPATSATDHVSADQGGSPSSPGSPSTEGESDSSPPRDYPGYLDL
jgi:hypothetical protein